MSQPPPVPEGSKSKVALTGPQKSLLVPLYSRWKDCQPDRPAEKALLNDKWAGYVLQQLDVDWESIGLKGFFICNMILRTRQLNQWTTEYLNNHSEEPVQVLHLACGLDARSHRITWGRNVRWIDVDLPEVVDLRRKLLPEPEGDYTLLAGSVLDDDFINTIPNDRPTVVVFEGLIMYLDPPDAESMIARLCARFGTAAPGRNQLLFDVVGPAMAAMQKWTAVFKAALWLQTAGADWKYAVDEPVALEKLHPGLKLVTGILCTEHQASIKELPSRYQWGCWLMAKLPGLRYATMWLRYSF